jgi:hypothetical protein
MVKWLHENLSEGFTSIMIGAAAGNGQMDILEWLDANHYEGCTMRDLNPACGADYLDVAKWLYQHCAPDKSRKSLEWVLLFAADRGRLETCR